MPRRPTKMKTPLTPHNDLRDSKPITDPAYIPDTFITNASKVFEATTDHHLIDYDTTIYDKTSWIHATRHDPPLPSREEAIYARRQTQSPESLSDLGNPIPSHWKRNSNGHVERLDETPIHVSRAYNQLISPDLSTNGFSPRTPVPPAPIPTVLSIPPSPIVVGPASAEYHLSGAQTPMSEESLSILRDRTNQNTPFFDQVAISERLKMLLSNPPTSPAPFKPPNSAAGFQSSRPRIPSLMNPDAPLVRSTTANVTVQDVEEEGRMNFAPQFTSSPPRHIEKRGHNDSQYAQAGPSRLDYLQEQQYAPETYPHQLHEQTKNGSSSLPTASPTVPFWSPFDRGMNLFDLVDRQPSSQPILAGIPQHSFPAFPTPGPFHRNQESTPVLSRKRSNPSPPGLTHPQRRQEALSQIRPSNPVPPVDIPEPITMADRQSSNLGNLKPLPAGYDRGSGVGGAHPWDVLHAHPVGRDQDQHNLIVDSNFRGHVNRVTEDPGLEAATRSDWGLASSGVKTSLRPSPSPPFEMAWGQEHQDVNRGARRRTSRENQQSGGNQPRVGRRQESQNGTSGGENRTRSHPYKGKGKEPEDYGPLDLPPPSDWVGPRPPARYHKDLIKAILKELEFKFDPESDDWRGLMMFLNSASRFQTVIVHHHDMIRRIRENLKRVGESVGLQTPLTERHLWQASPRWTEKNQMRLNSCWRTLEGLQRLIHTIAIYDVTIGRDHVLSFLAKILEKFRQYDQKLVDLASKFHTMYRRLYLRHLHHRLVQAHEEAQELLNHARAGGELSTWQEAKDRRAELRREYVDLRNKLAGAL